MAVVRKSYKVGDVWPTKSGVDVEIIKTFKGSQRVVIKWLDEYQHTTEIYQCALPRSNLKNPYERTIIGVGFLGTSYAAQNPLKFKREKIVWSGLFKRAYDEKTLIERPGYAGATVNAGWHEFGGFVDWTEQAVGWKNKNWHVDKDLILRGNREYGPETCCMLPPVVNSALWVREHILPPGVTKLPDGYYRGGFYEDGKVQQKRFKTPEEAFEFYKPLKEGRIKQLADEYRYQIDPRAYDALMTWEIGLD
jgi:hypothetical protein